MDMVYLYELLNDSADLLDQSDYFTEFYATHTADNIGKFTAIRHLIEDENIVDALTLLEEITPTNDIEEYQVFMLQLTLSHYPAMELNDEEKAQVVEIANLKVWLAGPVVYAARNWVSLELLDTEEEEEERMVYTFPSMSSAYYDNVKLVPNPVSDILNIMNFPDDSELHIVIRDNIGKMVAESYKPTLSLSKLENGVYTVKIIIDNQRTLTVKKLVVLR